MKQHLPLLASAIVLGLNSPYIAAQNLKNTPDSSEYNTIESITVLGRAATEDAELGGVSLKALPINTHVVGRAEIERLRFVDPDEFLDRIPGETQVRNLRIPDGSKSYTIPMLDGLPLESPYEGATQRLDRVNTFDIERVEVIKGPASALYPNNAFGGVVNVISRDAPLTPQTKVSLEAGDFNRLRAGLNTGGKVDNLSYFFDVNTRSLEGLREKSVNDKDQVSGKLTYQLSDATRLSTRFEYLDENKVTRGDLTQEQLKADPTQAGGLSSSADLTQTSLSVGLVHLLKSGQFDVALVRREKDTVGQSRFRGPQDENDLGYSSKLMYRHDFSHSNVIIGYNGYHSEQDTDRYARGDSDLTGAFESGLYHLNINAYFAQYRVNATDNLVLTAGLRHENIHLASSEYNQAANFSELAPKLGLTYQLNTEHMVWLGVSEGLYVPNLRHLYDPQEGNANLKPEEASNIELGFRGSIAGWQYDTSVYYNDITNYLVTQEFEHADGTEYERTTNAGQVNIQGIETVLEYAPKDLNWRFGLTHTFAKNTYDSFVQSTPGADDDLSGKTLRRSPKHHLNARIAWLPITDLILELEGDFYSSYYADHNNTPESEFTRDPRINLRADYQLADWRIWLHALNLSDTMEDRATYSRGTMRFKTIDGRTLYAGVSYTF